MRDRRRHALGRQLDHHLPYFRRAVDPPAQMQFIERGDVRADALPHSMQADRGNMMLGAGVVAPADLDADILQVLGDPPGREYLCQRSRKPL